MRRSRKWLLGSVLGVGVLLVLGAVLVPLLVDVETFRGPIEQALDEATGWQSSIGEMELAVLGGLELRVSPAGLAAPGDGSRLEVEQVRVRAAWLPLLQGRLDVGGVTLDGARMHLVRRRGSDGWELPVGAAGEAPAGESGPASASRVAIGTVRLRRGSLTLEDRTSEPPMLIELHDVDLTLEGDDVRGHATAPTLSLGDPLPDAHDVRMELHAGPGRPLELEILDGRMGAGRLIGTVRADPSDPTVPLIFEGTIDEAVLGGLLAGIVSEAESSVTGATGVKLTLALDLSRPQLDARALGGRLELGSSSVGLPGWDLGAALRAELDRRLGRGDGGTARPASEPLLDRLELSVDFDRWPWGIDRFSLAAEGIQVTGQGHFDPLEGKIDLDLTASLDAARSEELISGRSALEVLRSDEGRLSLPLRLTGPILSPSARVELDDLVSGALEQEKDRAVEGLVRGLLDRLRD